MTTINRVMKRIVEVSNKLPQNELDEALGIKNKVPRNNGQNIRHTK